MSQHRGRGHPPRGPRAGSWGRHSPYRGHISTVPVHATATIPVARMSNSGPPLAPVARTSNSGTPPIINKASVHQSPSRTKRPRSDSTSRSTPAKIVRSDSAGPDNAAVSSVHRRVDNTGAKAAAIICNMDGRSDRSKPNSDVHNAATAPGEPNMIGASSPISISSASIEGKDIRNSASTVTPTKSSSKLTLESYSARRATTNSCEAVTNPVEAGSAFGEIARLLQVYQQETAQLKSLRERQRVFAQAHPSIGGSQLDVTHEVEQTKLEDLVLQQKRRVVTSEAKLQQVAARFEDQMKGQAKQQVEEYKADVKLQIRDELLVELRSEQQEQLTRLRDEFNVRLQVDAEAYTTQLTKMRSDHDQLLTQCAQQSHGLMKEVAELRSSVQEWNQELSSKIAELRQDMQAGVDPEQLVDRLQSQLGHMSNALANLEALKDFPLHHEAMKVDIAKLSMQRLGFQKQIGELQQAQILLQQHLTSIDDARAALQDARERSSMALEDKSRKIESPQAGLSDLRAINNRLTAHDQEMRSIIRRVEQMHNNCPPPATVDPIAGERLNQIGRYVDETFKRHETMLVRASEALHVHKTVIDELRWDMTYVRSRLGQTVPAAQSRQGVPPPRSHIPAVPSQLSSASPQLR